MFLLDRFSSENKPFKLYIYADSGPNAVLRYSLIGGNNQGHFAIDSLTGDVTVVQPLDYEIVRNYRLVVRAQGKIRCLVIEKSAILYILICY